LKFQISNEEKRKQMLGDWLAEVFVAEVGDGLLIEVIGVEGVAPTNRSFRRGPPGKPGS
jgi:hypothetical protein